MTTRRLAAILAADVVGFSAHMERDEEGTYARIGNLRREVFEPRLSEHRGRLIKTTGDGFLAEFASPIAALRCALAIQSTQLADPNALRLRIGLNLGDVIVEEGGDVYGEGINVAARLEGLADPGGILISGKIYSEVEGKVEADFEDRGEQQVKNITRPVRVYSVCPVGTLSRPAPTISKQEPFKAPPLPDKPSIAVLPFQNMSGDPEQEYFADGMVEEIITALSRFNSLFVIARNSSFIYKDKAVDIKQIGRELGVRYVLEGSVRKAGNKVRITGQLIDAVRGAHLWADKFEGLLDDVFELQDRVTSSVVGVIAPRIERVEIERATTKPTSNLQAYDWYLRGLARFDRPSSDGMASGIQNFKNAIALDPNFAGAMACIGVCHAVRALQGWIADPVNDAAEAMHYAQLAQQRGSNDADVLARSAMTMTIGTFNADLDTANALADRAVSLNPKQALGWAASGWVKRCLGYHQLAIDHFSRALQLNPFDPANGTVMTGMAWAHFLLGEYEDTQSVLQKALADSPKHLPALRLKAALDAALGELERARQTADRILELNPGEKISNINVVRLSRRPEDRTKSVEFLRLAGLPE